MPEFFVLRTAKTWRPAGCIRPIFLSCWTRLILTALPVRVGLREVKRIVYLVSLMLFRILSIQEESSVYRFRPGDAGFFPTSFYGADRSEEHTSELQSQSNLVCRLLLEKKKKKKIKLLTTIKYI